VKEKGVTTGNKTRGRSSVIDRGANTQATSEGVKGNTRGSNQGKRNMLKLWGRKTLGGFEADCWRPLQNGGGEVLGNDSRRG